MSFLFKKIITSLILASFLMAVFFGLNVMTHDANGRMTGDCPFLGPGVPLCPQNLLTATIHHLSAYYSFSNVPIGISLVVALMVLMLLALVLFSSSLHPPWPKLLSLVNQSHAPLLFSRRDPKIARWLSLLENSPTSL